MMKLLQLLLDAIAPRKPRLARSSGLSIEHVSMRPQTHLAGNLSITTLLDYRSADVAALIQSLKYDGSAHAAALLAHTLHEYLEEELLDHHLASAHPVYLVPLPLHESRTRERGFNQIERILQQLPRAHRDGPLSFVRTDVLVRTRHTEPQTRLPRAARLRNVADAFMCTDERAVRDARIFLIDDVTTTGATLLHAERALRLAGAKVTPLALAHAH